MHEAQQYHNKKHFKKQMLFKMFFIVILVCTLCIKYMFIK